MSSSKRRANISKTYAVQNVCRMSILREYGCPCSYRDDLKILRKLICQGDLKYRKVWSHKSNKAIAVQGSRIHFDNYSTCYSGTGFHGKPKLLYHQLDTGDGTIKDSLLCEVQTETITLENERHRRCMLSLTNRNCLLRCDSNTGNVLERVYLHPHYKFTDMSWNVEDESFVMNSTLQPSLTAQERQVGARRSVLLALCAFTVAPLRFVALLEIDKTIFGADASGAMVSHDLLNIFHNSGHVRVYSFQTILNEFRVSECSLNQLDPESNEVIGARPLGLPINVKVTECPPCLLELRCENHDINIGGLPWHYIYCPRKRFGHFRICKLDTHKLAVNGEIEMDGMNPEPDKIMFHFSDPSRVIQIGPSVFKAFKLVQNDNGTTELKHEFSIESVDEPDGIPLRMVRCITSSGRMVRKPVYDDIFGYPDFGFSGANYENELDLLCLTTLHQEDDDCVPYGVFCLHDNNTGQLLREIRIKDLGEHYEHQVSIDLDTIVQVVKLAPGNFQCFVYKLMPKKEKERRHKRVCHARRIHEVEGNRPVTRQQRRHQQSTST